MKIYKFVSPVVKAGFFVSLLVLSSCSLKPKNQESIVIVQIKDSKLTSSQFAKELSKRLKNFDILSARDDQFVTQAKKSVIHDFLHEYIVSSWASKNNMSVSKTELEEEFQKIRSQYPDDISFREAFATENQDMESWLKKLKLKLLEYKVQTQLTENVEKPTDKQVKDFFKANKKRFNVKKAVKIRQIVTQNKLEGERIRKLVRKGRNFEDLAKKYSIAPDASLGGKTDWIEHGTMDVFDKAFKLKRGATSPIWQSPYGHHIIQVLKSRSARQLSFRNVKDQIVKELFEDRKQATYTSWIDKQVKSLKVLINEDALAAIKVDVNIQ